MEMDEESRNASLKLWDIMERIGVSERMRRLYRDEAIRDEILSTITDHMVGKVVSRYRFGSSCEGTTTPGMSSDVDVVYCSELFSVIQDITAAPPGNCLLVVKDSNTRPGYVKLQLVANGMPLTANNCMFVSDDFTHDCVGRVCHKHIRAHGPLTERPERNGPADTECNVEGYSETDRVLAYKCTTFYPGATESLLECARVGWLTSEDVNKMLKSGCLFVGVGHPASKEKEIEWRVSFSLQERQLMFNLNPTQHVCYVLLKIIKNMITSQPDVGKSVTSYHCKLCLLGVITKTSPGLWTCENLIDCTFTCLDELLHRVQNGICPHFFIKENNMFERRVYGRVQARLIHHLQQVIREGFRVFYRIQSDYIGDMFRGSVASHFNVSRNFGKSLCDVYLNAGLHLLYHQSAIGRCLNSRSSTDAKKYLHQHLDRLPSLNTINEHSLEDTKQAVHVLQAVLHVLYAQYIASEAFSSGIQHESKDSLLQTSAHHCKSGMTFDLMAGRLVFATILYKDTDTDMCLCLLEQIDNSACAEMVSVCGCHMFYRHVNEDLMKLLLSIHADQQTIMELFLAVCVIFLPDHSEIVPLPLKFEFHRSFGIPRGSRKWYQDDWYDWAVVDAKVYLYFMKYLLFSQLNRHKDKRAAIEKLWSVLQEDRNLGHRETGYNLLGWIHAQEGHIETAAYCFLQSWRIRPHNNAAKWHMVNLMFRQYATMT